MDFSHPWSLMSGMFIGLVGMAMVMYGKKQQRLAPAATGIVLCVFPYFVTNLLMMWGCFGACIGIAKYLGRDQ